MKTLLFPLFAFWSVVLAQLPGNDFRQNALPSFIASPALNTTARLIAESDAFVPGEDLLLGVVLEMKNHWHTYWINPGDAGAPTYVDWDLPEGFTASEIIWPTPIRFDTEGLASFGYEDKVILRVRLSTPADLTVGTPVTLSGTVNWLECKEACLPGSQQVTLTLTAAEEMGVPNPEMRLNPDKMVNATDWTAEVETEGDQVLLRVDAPASKGPFVQFFPFQEGAWILEPAPTVRRDGDEVVIELTRNPAAPDGASDPNGLLINEQGVGFAIADYRSATEAVPPADGTETEQRSAGYMLLLAFVAGIGMNLLPCIFPVLGLKISGFVEQAQGDPKSVRAHALVFAAGVILSLWILGAVVGLLGAAWGVQFQNPKVVIGMLLVLTFFTMNLFGIFELGAKLTTVGGDLTQKSGYAGSFFQGILLTVIGTPCTGPILAGSIVWMLTQPLWIGFIAFTLMGIGMSLPYVVLAYSPKLIEKLPRPGTWMITFKKASAFMIVLFLWVLLYVLKGQISAEGLVQVVGALLMVAFAAWVLGTWAAPGRSARAQRIAKLLCLLLLGVSVWIAYGYHEKAEELDGALSARIEAGDPVRYSDVTPELAEELIADDVPLHYRPWSRGLVEQLQREGRPVFVDFTADWCTICKINKFKALHKAEVMKAFQEKGVVTLRADWTGRDALIASELAAYNRQGVPVYMLFRPEAGTRAELLPEKLNPEIIFEALDNL